MLSCRARSLLSIVALLCGGAALPARAGVTVTLDAEALNELLAVMAPDTFVVPLIQGRDMAVHLDNLKVAGFDPAAGPTGDGAILATAHLRVPQLGIDGPVEPRLALRVGAGSDPALELRFVRFEVRLPLAGPLDVAALIPVQRFPAGGISSVAGGRGDARITTRVTSVRIGRDALRLELDVSAQADP